MTSQTSTEVAQPAEVLCPGISVIPRANPAPQSRPTLKTRIAIALYALVAIASVFFVPYLFPVARSSSLSFLFGFNNKVGILLLLAFCAAGALRLRTSSLFQLRNQPDRPISRRTLLLGLLLTATFCAAAWPLVTAAHPIGDSAYLINRIRLLHAGRRPYLDFEYAYGPMFLYVPLWISRILHLHIPAAYFIFWITTELLGVIVLARVLNAIDIRTSARPAIFLLFCFASAATFVIGAASYTFFRFALVPFLAFWIRDVEMRLANRSFRAWTAASLAIAAFGFLLLVSPELPLAFGIAFVAFCLLQREHRNFRSGAALVVMLAGMAAIFWLANRAHILTTMKTFSTGARDFPMVPSLHLVLFMVCVFFGILHLARALPSRLNSTSVLLVLVSTPMLASALGSCDSLHVFFSGLGFLAIGFIYLHRSKSAWQLTQLVFCVFFVFAIFWGLVIERSQEIDLALHRLSGQPTATARLSQQSLFPRSRGILEAPFGFRSRQVEDYSVPWVDTGYFLGVLNAPSRQDVAIKERELNDHPLREVLVPRTCAHGTCLHPQKARLWLELEFLAPYNMPFRHFDDTYASLCQFIDRNYHQVSPATARSLHYSVWERNQNSRPK